MSCPFYAKALFWIDPDRLRALDIPEDEGLAPVLATNPGSNQCALVTKAHSPCIMQIEGAGPDWDRCIRNPLLREDLMDSIVLHAKNIYVRENIGRDRLQTVSLDQLPGSLAIAHAFRFLRTGKEPHRDARPRTPEGGLTQ